MTTKDDTAGTTTMDRLCKVRDVARHLAICRTRVYQLMDAGELPYVKLGKSRRIKASEVQKLIERKMVGGIE